MEAARLAPSACNSQPWKFVIVKAMSLKERIIRECFNGVYAINSFAKKASVLVVLYGKKPITNHVWAENFEMWIIVSSI